MSPPTSPQPPVAQRPQRDDRTASAPPPGTRDRLIAAMAQGLRDRGYRGLGVADLLREAGAPKGVLYHHFPGGKAELAEAAIGRVTDQMVQSLDRLLSSEPKAVDALEKWMSAAQVRLDRSGYATGCPLATVALETTPDDQTLRTALARSFQAIRGSLQRGLVAAGMEPDAASAHACLVVAAYEGALLQARVAQDGEPLRAVTRSLVKATRAAIDAARLAPGSPASPDSPSAKGTPS